MENYNRDNRSGQGRNFGGRRDFGSRDSGGRGGRRDMFQAVCAQCGKDCQIPFEPRDGRPVYCSDCFEKKEGGSSESRSFQDRGPRRPSFDRDRRDAPRPQSNARNEQLEAISHKLDKLLDMLATSLASAPVKEVEVVKAKKAVKEVVSEEAEVKAPKKKAVAKKK